MRGFRMLRNGPMRSKCAADAQQQRESDCRKTVACAWAWGSHALIPWRMGCRMAGTCFESPPPKRGIGTTCAVRNGCGSHHGTEPIPTRAPSRGGQTPVPTYYRCTHHFQWNGKERNVLIYIGSVPISGGARVFGVGLGRWSLPAKKSGFLNLGPRSESVEGTPVYVVRRRGGVTPGGGHAPLTAQARGPFEMLMLGGRQALRGTGRKP